MAEVTVAKTASRSILGSMNDFTWMAGAMVDTVDLPGLFSLSMRLANTPIMPMGGKSPAKVLAGVVERSASCTDIH